MTSVRLGPGGEFDRVRAIAAALGSVLGPIGDDTAVIPDGEGTLVASIDASIENVHFRRDWISAEELGWRAAASALSDLAAAAAAPMGLLVAVVVPPGAGEAAVVEVMRGVGAVAREIGAKVFGGDLTSGAAWAVTISVFGRAARPMSRSGAVPGDGIWVTGELGGARAAVDAWTAGTAPDPRARHAFAHPVPRIAAAQWLAASGATAMMDLSDGLGGDAEHIAAASGARLCIALEHLPVHAALHARPVDDGAAALLAASGGEDYELLVTLPAGFDAAEAFKRIHGIRLTRIGDVVAGSGVDLRWHGEPREVSGYRHSV